MKAIRIHKTGDSSVLSIDEIDKPYLKEDHVLVRVRANSLNHMDLWVRKGLPGMGGLPLILGCDASGVVEELGTKTHLFSKGDRVFLFPLLSCGFCDKCRQGLVNYCKNFKIYGEHMNGTNAEYISVPQTQLLKLDSSLSFEQGAAFPLVYLTAWHMLKKANLQSGQTILIMGGSSGVGSAAIQLAKFLGAEIITTVGNLEKKKLAEQLGADHVILHYEEDIAKTVQTITSKKGADIIFEHVGEKVWSTALKCLSWGGTLVTCGATTGPNVQLDLRHIFIKQQQILGSTMGTWQDLKEVHDLIVSQKFNVSIAKEFDFLNIQAAHDYLEKGEGFGKVIIKWF